MTSRETIAMPAVADRGPIRVLIDLYHDPAWGRAPIRIEPDDVFQTTTCRERLRWGTLEKYHVLVLSVRD